MDLFSGLPEPITEEIGLASLHLSFQMCFSNLLHIDLHVTNHGRRTMKNCRFSVEIAGVSLFKYFIVSFSKIILKICSIHFFYDIAFLLV